MLGSNPTCRVYVGDSGKLADGLICEGFCNLLKLGCDVTVEKSSWDSVTRINTHTLQTNERQ